MGSFWIYKSCKKRKCQESVPSTTLATLWPLSSYRRTLELCSTVWSRVRAWITQEYVFRGLFTTQKPDGSHRFFSVTQLYWSRLSVGLLLYDSRSTLIRLDHREKSARDSSLGKIKTWIDQKWVEDQHWAISFQLLFFVSSCSALRQHLNSLPSKY